MADGFHYQRTPEEDGGVVRIEGAPAGARLARLLDGGLPPMSVAMELVAAFCEIVYIAHDDGVSHGDVTLEDVWLTGDGKVSIGGFGQQRSSTRAPERVPVGPDSDLYGLGRIAASVLTHGHHELDAAPRESANDHDDAVADYIMAADLGELDEGMLNDIRWFLLYLMSFDHKDRPDALRTWRTFIAFARTVQGPSLPAWAERAIRGRAERRRAVRKAAPNERLDGPRAVAGPLGGGMSFSSSGGRTMFWTPDEEGEPEGRIPEVGGGAKTGHWSVSELAAMARDDAAAPKPVRRGGAPPPPPARSQPAPAPAFAPPPQPVHTATPPPAPAFTTPPASSGPQTFSGTAYTPQLPPSPVVATTMPVATPGVPAEPPAKKKKRKKKGLKRYSTGVLVFLGFAVALFVAMTLLLTFVLVRSWSGA